MNKTLIYIIGAGRSGTTLLDILLGNNMGFLSLGEINRFFKRKGIPPKRKHDNEIKAFWKKIRIPFKEELKINFVQMDKIFKRNEYHSAVFKSIFRKNDKTYIEALSKQYSLLFTETKEHTLIESSKYPVRALNISNYILSKDYEIKFIYLKKDPVNVVKSFQKKELEQPPKGFFLANLYYLSINILCVLSLRILKRRNHKVSSITYEELITNPEKTIQKLSKDLVVDLNFLLKKTKNKEALKPGFLFDGNRIRLKKTISLQALKKSNKKDVKFYFSRIFNYMVYRR